jgi:Heavy-metal resistance
MKVVAIVLGLFLATTVLRAQDPRGPGCVIGGVPHPPNECGPGRPGEDPLARYLFPPELVMANQQAIGLTESQRNQLQEAMMNAQGKFIGLQFKMTSEVETLQRLLQPSNVDESKVLEQVDRVLAVEREIKRAQLSLVIRIKNLLTEKQQAQLAALRRQVSGE